MKDLAISFLDLIKLKAEPISFVWILVHEDILTVVDQRRNGSRFEAFDIKWQLFLVCRDPKPD